MKTLILRVLAIGIFALSTTTFVFAADSQEFLDETEKELQDNWGEEVLQDPIKEESEQPEMTFDAVEEAEADDDTEN